MRTPPCGCFGRDAGSDFNSWPAKTASLRQPRIILKCTKRFDVVPHGPLRSERGEKLRGVSHFLRCDPGPMSTGIVKVRKTFTTLQKFRFRPRR